jgi:hypothetical protein
VLPAAVDVGPLPIAVAPDVVPMLPAAVPLAAGVFSVAP